MLSAAMIHAFVYKPVALALVICIAAAGLPRLSRGDTPVLPAGAASPAAAARMPSSGYAIKPHGGRLSVDAANALRYGAFGYAAQPDSTEDEFEFPEDEGSHLARDITVFVIASVFIAFFIIKVFLEGDTDETDNTDGGGKDIPTS